MSVQSPVAIVSGATSGIGRATALALAAGGAHVVAVSQESTRAQNICASIGSAGGSASAVVCDLADRAAVSGVVGRVLERAQRDDVLVNCAAVFTEANILTESVEDWQAVLDVTLTAPFLLP